MLKSLLLALVSAVFFAGNLTAQESPARASFAYALGNAKSADGLSTYAVSATAPSMSPEKGHQLKFSISRLGAGGGSSWNYFMVGTGKSKSVAQIQSLIAAGLRKFPGAAAGTELCKIGDIKYGGELKLIARSANELEFAFDPAIRSGNPRLSAADVAAFAEILGK